MTIWPNADAILDGKMVSLNSTNSQLQVTSDSHWELMGAEKKREGRKKDITQYLFQDLYVGGEVKEMLGPVTYPGEENDQPIVLFVKYLDFF